MKRRRYAVRLPNGTVRGFVGPGDGPGEAGRDVHRQAARAAGRWGEAGGRVGVVVDVSELSPRQRVRVQADWVAAELD